jgi:hypothetical protein
MTAHSVGTDPSEGPVTAPASAVAAANELLTATPQAARVELALPFTDALRSDWHYVPRVRSGLAWGLLSSAQRAALTRLLESALVNAGLHKVYAVMRLEIALRELEGGSPRRDPENYAIALFGTPARGTAQAPAHWGWRLEGHHLSLHFTLEGDRYISSLPQFMGANPALVPRDFVPDGPRHGTRVLGIEEDLARQLLGQLGPQQRAAAVFDTAPYGDIVTRHASNLSPLAPVGVRLAEISSAQQALLLKLITAFAEHLRPELLEARLDRVRSGGFDSIRFGWAGSLESGKPYYFRIQGATFLIEFDNSGGNHVHSVWRDFDGDWGRDILAEHYANSAAPSHDHHPHPE